MPNEKETNHPVGHAAEEERGPIGVGSEATEGIHNVDMKGAHKRTGLEHRPPGTPPGSEPMRERAWVHESGYGGKSGKPRTSSDAREAAEKNSAPIPLPVPSPTRKTS